MIINTNNAELVDAIATWDGSDEASLNLILEVLVQSV